MGAAVRWLVGAVVLAGLVLLGRLIGITPTWQEFALITLATSFANGVQEGLR